MRSDGAPSLGSAPRVELAQTEDLETTEETVYTTGISTGMDDENLIQVNVSVSQTAASSAITNPASSGEASPLFLPSTLALTSPPCPPLSPPSPPHSLSS